MRRSITRSLLAAAGLVLAAPPGAGQFRFTTTDGTVVAGELTGWTAKAVRVEAAAGATSELGAAKILFFQGPATVHQQVGDMIVHLARDVHLSGDVRGGDEDGESLTIQSPALGMVQVSLDAMHLLRIRHGKRFRSEVQFAPGEGEEEKESVFRETPLGLDPVSGVLDRVGAKGVYFEWREDADAELFAWEKIAGLRLPPGDPPEVPDGIELVVLTADGSRLRGKPLGVTKEKLQLESPQLGKIAIALPMILGGHVVDASTRVFLPSLQPKTVEERGFLGPQSDDPFRVDRNVTGAALAVRRTYWTTGLGCHSLSRLTFVVPAGVKQFRCWVGADDTAVSGHNVGDMDFKVFRGGKEVASRLGVKGGQEAAPLPPIDVAPGDEIRLELGFGGGMHIRDRGNWLAPVFLK